MELDNHVSSCDNYISLNVSPKVNSNVDDCNFKIKDSTDDINSIERLTDKLLNDDNSQCMDTDDLIGNVPKISIASSEDKQDDNQLDIDDKTRSSTDCLKIDDESCPRSELEQSENDYSSSEQNDHGTDISDRNSSEAIYRYKCDWPNEASCVWCDEIFTARDQVKKHMFVKHGRETMYQCKHCLYKVRFKSRLTRHVASVHNKEPSDFAVYSAFNKGLAIKDENSKSNAFRRCSYCFYETYSDQIRSHVLAVHRVKHKPHFCLYCDFTTNNLAELSTHLADHDNMKTYGCLYCNYRTVRSTYIDRHMNLVHKSKVISGEYKLDNKSSRTTSKNKNDTESDDVEDDELFLCDQCQYSSTKQVDLNKHIIRSHQRHWKVEKIKKEDQEDSNSSDVQSDISQITTSEKKKFFCSKCNYVTIYESLYNEHIACNHGKTSNVVWYHCDYCPFVSIYPHSVKRHYETVHIKIRNRRPQGPAVPKVKSFECNFCRKVFMKKIAIRRHINRDHDADRPYNCTVCDYKSATRPELTRHNRLHHIA